ncbi:MAG: antitoxin [Nocardioides sp.]
MPTNESIQNQLKDLADTANQRIGEVRSKLGSLAHDNRGKLSDLIDKAGHVFDDKTQGKYADKVSKAKDQAMHLVDKVAEARSAGGPVAPDSGPHIDPGAGPIEDAAPPR